MEKSVVMNYAQISLQEVLNALSVKPREEQRHVEGMLAKLPEDCDWFRYRADETLYDRSRHVYHESWRALSNGSGKPTSTAQCIAEEAGSIASEYSGQVDHIKKLAESLIPEKCSPIILGTNDIQSGLFMLIDGNHRMSALCLGRRLHKADVIHRIEFFVASSSQPIWDWSQEH